MKWSLKNCILHTDKIFWYCKFAPGISNFDKLALFFSTANLCGQKSCYDEMSALSIKKTPAKP